VKRYHHGDLRRALLDATLALAEEYGAAGVTLRQAAERAGVSQTAPYRHFADKTAMLAAASEEGFRLLYAQMLAVSQAAHPIAAWAACYVEFAVAHTAHFRLMFGQGSAQKSTSVALQAAARDTFQLLFQTVKKRVKGDPRRLALEVWSLAHGMAVLAIDGQTRFLGQPPAQMGEAAQAAVAALLAGRRRAVRG
jgi:AcrR family transcriptional regulator